MKHSVSENRPLSLSGANGTLILHNATFVLIVGLYNRQLVLNRETERERDRDRDRDRQTDRQTETERDREGDRETETETES